MRFDVFISYSRTDVRLARSLHAALERVEVPIDAAGVGPQLRVFRDETDIRGTRYYAAIDDTLRSSRKLLVVCSPEARASRFVDDEIRRFLAHRSLDDVIAVIASGVPNNEAASDESKAFPEALGEMPLAADLSAFEPRRHRLRDREWEPAWHLILANVLDLPRSALDERAARLRDELGHAEALRLLDVATTRGAQGRRGEALLHLAAAHAVAPPSPLRASLHLATISAFPELVVERVLPLPVRPLGCVLDGDGSTVLAWGADNVGRMLDAATGRVLAEHPHPEVIWRGVFLPDGSGATFSRDGRVALLRRSGEVITWEAVSPVWNLLRYPGAEVFASLAISGHVCLWSPGSGEPLAVVDALAREHEPVTLQATFAADAVSLLVTDGSGLVVLGADGAGTVMTSERRVRVHQAHPGLGAFLVSEDATLGLLALDPATGNVSQVAAAEGEAPLKAAALDAQAERLAYLDTAGRLVLASTRSEEQTYAVEVPADVGELAWWDEGGLLIATGRHTACAVAAATGEVLWTRSFDDAGFDSAGVHPAAGLVSQIDLRGRRALLIDLTTGEEVDAGQSVVRPVRGVASARDAPRLALVTGELSLRVLGRRLRHAYTPVRRYDDVDNVIWRGARVLLGGRRDHQYAVLDAVTGDVAYPPLEAAGPFSAVIVSPEGPTLLGRGRDDGIVQLWRAEGDRAAPLAVPPGLQTPDLRASLSEDGRILAVATAGRIEVLDLTGQSTTRMQHASDHGYVQLQLGPRAERLAALSGASEVYLFDVADGEPVGPGARFDGPVAGFQFIATGEWLVAWSMDGSFVVVDCATGATTRIRHAAGGLFETAITGFHASSDGALLFSGGEDGRLRTWDRETAEEVAEAVRHPFPLRGLAPSDDAERILTWGGDTVTVWNPWSGSKAGPDVILDEQVANAYWTLDNEHAAICDGPSIRLYDIETAIGVAGPWHHGGEDVAGRFVDDALVTWTGDGSVAVWTVDVTGPVEDWRPLAERVTGDTLNADQRTVAPLTHDEHAALPDESGSEILARVYGTW